LDFSCDPSLGGLLTRHPFTPVGDSWYYLIPYL